MRNLPPRKLVNEEFVELIEFDPKFASGKEGILAAWENWKTGPETNPGDKASAAKEVIKHMNDWMKKNLK